MRLPAVLAATGWAKPTLYAKIADGKFPKGTKLDPEARAVVWFEDKMKLSRSGQWPRWRPLNNGPESSEGRPCGGDRPSEF